MKQFKILNEAQSPFEKAYNTWFQASRKLEGELNKFADAGQKTKWKKGIQAMENLIDKVVPLGEEDTGSDVGLGFKVMKKDKNKEITDYKLNMIIDGDNGRKEMKGSKWQKAAQALGKMIGQDVIDSDIRMNPDADALVWFELEQDTKGHYMMYGSKRIDLPTP